MPDVQTKPADCLIPLRKCSRTVNVYENTAHNTTKVSRYMGSPEEMLGMRNLCVDTVKHLREKGHTVTHVTNTINFVARVPCQKLGLKLVLKHRFETQSFT